MITPAYSPTATERVLPRLALDFTTGTLDSRVTVARALNTATRVNASGNIEVVNANLPRFDFDPSTLVCRGLLIEEARTNGLPNNTMAGAVAGSPGTAPTGWIVTTTGGVFTRTIVGVGVENGIAYIDIRYQTSGSGNASVQFANSNVIAALNGQVWTHSAYVKLVGGSLTNVTVNDSIIENNAAGAFLAGGDSANYVPTSASLISQRRAYTRTNTNALTAFVYSRTRIAFSGAADVTLRFGLPQLELGAFATSVVQTSAGAVTRNADVVSMTGTNFSSWYNQSQGTFLTDFTSNGYVANEMLFSATPGDLSAIIQAYWTAATTISADGGVSASMSISGAQNTASKFIYAYALNNYAMSVNATSPATDLSGTPPSTLSQLNIGNRNGSLVGNQHIRKFSYWPQRLTNAEVQAFSK